MQRKRLNHLLNFSEFKPNSVNYCSLDVSCMAPVMTSAALYWNESSFSLKTFIARLVKDDQYGVSETLCRLLVMIFLVKYTLDFYL